MISIMRINFKIYQEILMGCIKSERVKCWMRRKTKQKTNNTSKVCCTNRGVLLKTNIELLLTSNICCAVKINLKSVHSQFSSIQKIYIFHWEMRAVGIPLANVCIYETLERFMAIFTTLKILSFKFFSSPFYDQF